MNRGCAGDMAGKHSALLVPSGNEVASYNAARRARERPTIRRDVRDEVAAGVARNGKDSNRTAGVDVLRRNNGPASIGCGFNSDLGRRAQSDVEWVAGHRGQAAARGPEGVAGAHLVDRKVAEGRGPRDCVYRSGSAQCAAARIIKDCDANRGGTIRYQ